MFWTGQFILIRLLLAGTFLVPHRWRLAEKHLEISVEILWDLEVRRNHYWPDRQLRCCGTVER